MSGAYVTDPELIKVWATVFLGESIGIRLRDIAEKCGISTNAAECAAKAIVDAGHLKFRMQQVGTGGTQDRFYQHCPNQTCLTRP